MLSFSCRTEMVCATLIVVTLFPRDGALTKRVVDSCLLVFEGATGLSGPATPQLFFLTDALKSNIVF